MEAIQTSNMDDSGTPGADQSYKGRQHETDVVGSCLSDNWAPYFLHDLDLYIPPKLRKRVVESCSVCACIDVRVGVLVGGGGPCGRQYSVRSVHDGGDGVCGQLDVFQ